MLEQKFVPLNRNSFRRTEIRAYMYSIPFAGGVGRPTTLELYPVYSCSTYVPRVAAAQQGHSLQDQRVALRQAPDPDHASVALVALGVVGEPAVVVCPLADALPGHFGVDALQ